MAQRTTDPGSESEWLTRKRRIDPLLGAAGWPRRKEKAVDLLTTGVDIPDLEYLVLLRPVKSRILFVQMLGRGTRLGERYPDKSHFTAGEAREALAAYVPDGDLARFARDQPRALKEDSSATMKRLRDGESQGALLRLLRRDRTFVRATEYEDAVSTS